jgi:hypothetical protein
VSLQLGPEVQALSRSARTHGVAVIDTSRSAAGCYGRLIRRTRRGFPAVRPMSADGFQHRPQAGGASHPRRRRRHSQRSLRRWRSVRSRDPFPVTAKSNRASRRPPRAQSTDGYISFVWFLRTNTRPTTIRTSPNPIPAPC